LLAVRHSSTFSAYTVSHEPEAGFREGNEGLVSWV
jgi:hypothetical protein